MLLSLQRIQHLHMYFSKYLLVVWMIAQTVIFCEGSKDFRFLGERWENIEGTAFSDFSSGIGVNLEVFCVSGRNLFFLAIRNLQWREEPQKSRLTWCCRPGQRCLKTRSADQKMRL